MLAEGERIYFEEDESETTRLEVDASWNVQPIEGSVAAERVAVEECRPNKRLANDRAHSKRGILGFLVCSLTVEVVIAACLSGDDRFFRNLFRAWRTAEVAAASVD